MNEAPGPSPLGTTLFDSMLGLAVRRHCAPVLDLEPLAPAEDYLRRRLELGGAEVNARLMGATGIGTLLVDTGIGPADLSGPDEVAALCGGDGARGGAAGTAGRAGAGVGDRRTSPARSCSG